MSVATPSTSQIAAAIDALLGLCRASPGLADVSIFDGPHVVSGELTRGDKLFIGDTLGDEPSAESEQSFAALGRGARDEDILIRAAIETTGGEPDMKPRRDRAMALLGEVEMLLRQGQPGADPRLGGAVLWSHVSGPISLSQRQTDMGAQVELGFVVAARARL